MKELKPEPADPALLMTIPISILLLRPISYWATLFMSSGFDRSARILSYLKSGQIFLIYVILLYNFSLFLATITTPNPIRASSNT